MSVHPSPSRRLRSTRVSFSNYLAKVIFFHCKMPTHMQQFISVHSRKHFKIQLNKKLIINFYLFVFFYLKCKLYHVKYSKKKRNWTNKKKKIVEQYKYRIKLTSRKLRQKMYLAVTKAKCLVRGYLQILQCTSIICINSIFKFPLHIFFFLFMGKNPSLYSCPEI